MFYELLKSLRHGSMVNSYLAVQEHSFSTFAYLPFLTEVRNSFFLCIQFLECRSIYAITLQCRERHLQEASEQDEADLLEQGIVADRVEKDNQPVIEQVDEIVEEIIAGLAVI